MIILYFNECHRNIKETTKKQQRNIKETSKKHQRNKKEMFRVKHLFGIRCYKYSYLISIFVEIHENINI